MEEMFSDVQSECIQIYDSATTHSTYNCQVFLIDKIPVNEIVTENEDGTYTIFINEGLCIEKRILAYNHAINHIIKNDFEKIDVQKIEFAAHFN